METATIKKRNVTCFGHKLVIPDLPDHGPWAEKLFKKVEDGKWEPHTFENIRRFVDEKTDYIDIGAWIGLTTFWTAKRARNVIAVEPDPVSYARLQAVVDENARNVKLVHAALSDQSKVTLYAKKHFGGSRTSAVTSDFTHSVEVEGMTLSRLLESCGDSVFIKIDIEGLEYRLAEMIFGSGKSKIKGIQLALHPHLHAREFGLPWPLNRFKALRDTLRLFSAPPGYKVVKPVGSKEFFWMTVSRILFRRKFAGWEVLYARDEVAE